MLTPWKDSYDQSRQHIKKQTLLGPSSQSFHFLSSHVWIWELDYKESWEAKNVMLLNCGVEKTLESPLYCKEIQPVHLEYSLKRLMLKLKFQNFGHLMRRTDSFEKTLMLRKTEGVRSGWQRMQWLDGFTTSVDMSLRNSGSLWWTGRPGALQ